MGDRSRRCTCTWKTRSDLARSASSTAPTSLLTSASRRDSVMQDSPACGGVDERGHSAPCERSTRGEPRAADRQPCVPRHRYSERSSGTCALCCATPQRRGRHRRAGSHAAGPTASPRQPRVAASMLTPPPTPSGRRHLRACRSVRCALLAGTIRRCTVFHLRRSAQVSESRITSIATPGHAPHSRAEQSRAGQSRAACTPQPPRLRQCGACDPRTSGRRSGGQGPQQQRRRHRAESRRARACGSACARHTC